MEINEDKSFEKSEWRLQRLGWAAMAGIAVAAALGFFGPGLLNSQEASGDGIKVRFSRFERMNSPAPIKVSVDSGAVRGDLVQIWFSLEYANALEIRGATPPPESGLTAGDRVVYTFRAKPNQPATITFHSRLTEGTAGFLRGRIGLVSGGETEFWQFVWP